MDIKLTDEQTKFVKRRIESGKNRSEQDVIEDAFGRLIEDEILESADHEQLKATLQRARAQLDRGEGVPLTDRKALVREIVNESRRRVEARHTKSAAQ